MAAARSHCTRPTFKERSMSFHGFLQRSLPFAAVALISAAPIASAQNGQELFEWSGHVDREVQITMRGNQVMTNVASRADRTRGGRVFMQLPRRDGQMYVRVLNGRGSVDVVQQPTAQNGYTATVRVLD